MKLFLNKSSSLKYPFSTIATNPPISYPIANLPINQYLMHNLSSNHIYDLKPFQYQVPIYNSWMIRCIKRVKVIVVVSRVNGRMGIIVFWIAVPDLVKLWPILCQCWTGLWAMLLKGANRRKIKIKAQEHN